MSPTQDEPRYLSPHQKHLPGIYGGLGPLAHVLFEQQVLSAGHRRGARADQHYPVWLVASASATPNRMASLSGEGADARPYLAHYARLLEQAGADLLVVVCNTAHAYHADIQKTLCIPWMHLMEVTARHIVERLPDVGRVGVLGTDGTLKTGLYHDALSRHGLKAVAPELGSADQHAVMEAIFDEAWGIKATGTSVSPRARRQLADIACRLAESGAQAVIAGCTEVSAGLVADDLQGLTVVDPLGVAAELLLDVAYGHREPAEFFVR